MDVSTASPLNDDALYALALRSKAHWGYDAGFMQLAAPLLQLRPEWYAAGRVFEARIEEELAGVMVLLGPEDGVSHLEHLFVDPPFMGRGVGKALGKHAIALARSEGASRIAILSDPQARGFYERLGAAWVRDQPSATFPGRVLPLLELAL